MTSIFGGKVADEWGRSFRCWRAITRATCRPRTRPGWRAARTPVPLDDTLTEALVGDGFPDLVQTTHWPNIDLMGAQLNLYWAEFQIPVWRMQGRGWKLWDALTDGLAEDGVLDAYDLVFLDTPPALGYLTINGLAAADILLVPLGASFLEFDSTGRFFDMLHATFASIEEARTWPRAPGARGDEPSNGTRCARSSPATTAPSRPRWRPDAVLSRPLLAPPAGFHRA
jgi:chromosome partitioning protein